MIGIFYMGWVMVSHIGAKIREFNHYVNRHVDKQTNTYVDIYGTRRDNSTGQIRSIVINSNGDIILKDKKQRVVQNVSLEERIQKFKERREDPDRDLYFETVFKTKEMRITHPVCPVTNEKMFVQGPIYIDFETGNSYYMVSIDVNKEYCGGKNFEQKTFYVNVENPFDLVRISDYQKELERSFKDKGYYNWIDNKQNEIDFIKDYNSRPYKRRNLHENIKNTFINPI